MFREVYRKGKHQVEESAVEMSSDAEDIVTVVTETKVSAEDIATIATDTEVRAKALSVVKKKLGHILGTGLDSEVNQIAEDALNTVTVGLLNTCAEKAAPLVLEGHQEGDNILSHPIARYLIGGVYNYCNTRLKRWSGADEEGEVGTRARHHIKADDTGRADDAHFWDEHLSHEDSHDSIDHARVDALLSQRGVSEEDIALIKRNLAGWSFVELAEEFGGTADKYRRRIQRALDSAGIDFSLLK